MYFFNAIWYAASTIGFVSMILFIVLLLSIFNAEHIEKEVGYRNYLTILGIYALIVLPVAATINGGTGPDFLFFVGCQCPALWTIGDRLGKNYQVQRAQQLAAQAQLQPTAALPPLRDAVVQTMQTKPDQRPFAPAPSSLANDFDVPPQR